MTFAQGDVLRIWKRVVDHEMETALVAEQFEISRRVQQLVEDYGDHGEIPTLETSGCHPYAVFPDDLEERVLELHQRLGARAVTIVHVLRIRDDLSFAYNRVRAILEESEHVPEHSDKQGPNACGFEPFTIRIGVVVGSTLAATLSIAPVTVVISNTTVSSRLMTGCDLLQSGIMSLKRDDLETPADVFNRMLSSVAAEIDDPFTTEVTIGE